ncbi:MAG: sigma-70 family RNA polymerase sigma factor [Acholeplasmatales bacterium]|jgi:RNA polymerase primary sigma factor|nr:sigma-70 family RNA polymerase sigma factor [Acholeplasmatales bacterium]
METKKLNFKKIYEEVSKKQIGGTISVDDVVKYAPLDSPEYLELENFLNEKELFIMSPDEEDQTSLDNSSQESSLEPKEPLEFDFDEPLDNEDIPINLDIIKELELEEDEVYSNSSIEQIIKSPKLDDAVKMYLKEIGQYPMLSVAEEQEYSHDYINGKNAKEQLDEMIADGDEIDPDTLEALNELIEKGKVGKDKLVEHNCRLVVSIAKKYSSNNLRMQLLDLIQEGNLGLMKAVDRFDPNLGYKFSTLAHWWIRQAISRAVADQGRTIRIPVHMVETINRMNRISNRLTQELGREPNSEELAVEMGLTPDKITSIQRISKEPLSLETPVGDDEETTYGDFVSDPGAETPDEIDSKERKNQVLYDILRNVLTDREERVIRLRYGLHDGRVYTLEEVGKMFKVTRERIRQIESKALKKLKVPSRVNKIREYFNNNN